MGGLGDLDSIVRASQRDLEAITGVGAVRARDPRGVAPAAGAQSRRAVPAALSRARGLAAGYAVFGLFWGSWAACLPAIQRATGASDTQLGLALLCVALAALPAMLVAGRLADVFGARLVPIFLVFFGAVEWLPGLAHSVSMLVVFLAVIGIGTGLLDIAINAHAARLEALHGIRIMDGLHAAFSGGVLVGGIGSGLLRRAGAHPAWILAVSACSPR